MALEQAWYPVAFSPRLPSKPLAVTLLGQRLVLFPDGQGGVGALEDRCPHRGVSLSLGQSVEGTVACPYHGWRFDAQGALRAVPSALPDEKLPPCSVPRAHARFEEGTLWVSVAPLPPPRVPPWAHHGERGYHFLQWVTDVACPMEWVVQNFVDCAHTGILHRGLFRTQPERPIQAHVRLHERGVEVENLGETNPDSLLSRLLSRGKGTVRHTDTFIAPHTVEVNYAWGERHVVTTSICQPVTTTQTRIFTRVGVRFGWLSPALLWALWPITVRVLAQDRAILENQAQQLARYPERPLASSRSDLPCLWVERSYRHAVEGTTPPRTETRDIRYRL